MVGLGMGRVGAGNGEGRRDGDGEGRRDREGRGWRWGE